MLGRLLAIISVGGVAAAHSGCSVAQPVGFDERTPSGRIRATLQAAERGDTSAIPDLVEQLDADDPLVRLLAQRALERMTGRTMGYDHAAPPHEREAAIERWVAWVRAEGLASPAEEPSDGPGGRDGQQDRDEAGGSEGDS